MQRRLLGAIAALVGAIGCGGGDDGPTSPSPAPPGGSVATITITAGGVSPRSLTVAPGTRVTFVNSDTRRHDMFSDPHPTHGSCPELDQVGFIAAGQSKTSGNLNAVGTCTFHDHELPTNTGLQGTIRVQ